MRKTVVVALMTGVMILTPALSRGKGSEAVEVKNAWVRGTVPGQTTTGAFMTLRSRENAKVVGVATPVARRAEIHASEMKDGIMRMRPVPQVTLPAGKDVPLQGDLHVMLMEVTHPLGAGETVPLTVTVEDAKGQRSSVEVRAPVRPLGQ
jgi:copper(I)-binding protein